MPTRFQEDLLTRYLGFRKTPPTVGRLVMRNAVAIGGWTAFLLLLAGACWWSGARLCAAALLGFVASTLLHATAGYVRTTDLWPLIERITDWQAVERLAGAPDQARVDRPRPAA